MNESKQAMLELADRIKGCREKRIYDVGLSGDEKLLIETALRASAPQEDGRALERIRDFPHSGDPSAQAMVQIAAQALSAPPSVALEAGDLTDDQIMEILRRVTKDELYEMLTCKRWKDGIDITGPTYAAEQLAKEFRAALTRPQPGGAVAGTHHSPVGEAE
jgi:hypothetical protein